MSESNVRKFYWKAYINNTTGLAQSIESSFSFPPVSQNILIQMSTLKRTFENYPQFLGFGHVVPGLRVMQSNPRDKASVSRTFIRDPVFGTKLLEFGKPRSRLRTRQLHTCIPIMDGSLVQKNEQAIGDKKQKSFGYLDFTASFENYDSDPSKIMMMITTKIINYPPKIAGPAPVCLIRKAIYLKSQSLLHAYVMWRFHSHCHKAVTDIK